MDLALRLARRSLGNCWPNPAVGAVIVQDPDGVAPRVLGRGWTQPGGRPHAETEALGRATALVGRKHIAGATAYVTLEPCNHHGRSPPCTEALIEAGVSRVVAAITDPDPRVSGSGIARLRSAGVSVSMGAGAAAAQAVNAGFLMRVAEGRPWVTWKTATTLDGRIATADGASRWITGPAARARGHLLRAQQDAIMVGIETALRDDPSLDCRLPGLLDRSPVRIVVDSRQRLPPTAKLAQRADERATWLVTAAADDTPLAAALHEAGVTLISVPEAEGGVDLPAALRALGERGITRLLVEGGARLSTSLLQAGLVDEIAWFRAPRLIGGDGLPAATTLGVDALADAPGFRRSGRVDLGPDVLETYVREANE